MVSTDCASGALPAVPAGFGRTNSLSFARSTTKALWPPGSRATRWDLASKLAKVIEQKFGVHYDQDHVGRLLHKLGLRTRRRPAPAPAYVPSTYSPNVDRMASEISPTVA